MHTSRVRVVPFPVAVGGWKGELTIEGDRIRIQRTAGGSDVLLELSQVKRASFTSSNGLWSFRLNDRRRVCFQSAGALFSADRSDAGGVTNELIHEQLAEHGVPLLSM